MLVSCLVVTSRRSRDRKRDFQLQTTQMLEASCLFSFKSILLRTSGKCQSIKRTACMLNFIYIVQSKWYLRLKISVQGPFKISADVKQHVLLVYDILPSTTAVFSYVCHRSQKTVSLRAIFSGWCSNSSKFVTNNSDCIRRLFNNWPCC